MTPFGQDEKKVAIWDILKSSLNGVILYWREPLSFCLSLSHYLDCAHEAGGGAASLQPEGHKLRMNSTCCGDG